MSPRPYDPTADREDLWALKAAFERELGAAGGDGKATAYEGKLTDAYRERWLAWVDRCVADDARCVTVAEADGDTAIDPRQPPLPVGVGQFALVGRRLLVAARRAEFPLEGRQIGRAHV